MDIVAYHILIVLGTKYGVIVKSNVYAHKQLYGMERHVFHVIADKFMDFQDVSVLTELIITVLTVFI
jgi:hypothetical protein